MFLVICYSISINLCGRDQDNYFKALCTIILMQLISYPPFKIAADMTTEDLYLSKALFSLDHYGL